MRSRSVTVSTHVSSRPTHHRRSRIPFATAAGHGKIFIERRDGRRARSQRHGNRDRGAATRGPFGETRSVCQHPRFHRSQKISAAAEYQWRDERGGSGAARAARQGGGDFGLGETRNPSRPALSAARSDRDAEGHRDSREGRFYRAAIHQCRPGARASARRRRCGDGDAARLADRQQSRRRDAGDDRDHFGAVQRPRHRRCGPRCAESGSGGDGNGRGCSARESAIAIASDPLRMARAFRLAVEAGREAHLIGLSTPGQIAVPTSPLTSFLHPDSSAA